MILGVSFLWPRSGNVICWRSGMRSVPSAVADGSRRCQLQLSIVDWFCTHDVDRVVGVYLALQDREQVGRNVIALAAGVRSCDTALPQELGQGYRGQAFDFAILFRLRSIALIHAILPTVFFRINRKLTVCVTALTAHLLTDLLQLPR